MTPLEFNTKYKEYLSERFYGLDINIPELTTYLDNKFQEFIKLPDFKYMQIKAKFNMGRFYCQGLSQEQVNEVETIISELLNKHK